MSSSEALTCAIDVYTGVVSLTDVEYVIAVKTGGLSFMSEKKHDYKSFFTISKLEFNMKVVHPQWNQLHLH